MTALGLPHGNKLPTTRPGRDQFDFQPVVAVIIEISKASHVTLDTGEGFLMNKDTAVLTEVELTGTIGYQEKVQIPVVVDVRL